MTLRSCNNPRDDTIKKGCFLPSYGSMLKIISGEKVLTVLRQNFTWDFDFSDVKV
jgi:hypothetical protein